VKIHRLKVESHLTQALKKQVKDQKTELSAKEESIAILKRNMKSSRVMELEEDVKTYSYECNRLKMIIDEILSEKDPLTDKDKMRSIEG
jgi:hypothetical protein